MKTTFTFLIAMAALIAADAVAQESKAHPVDLLVVAPHPDDEVIGCSGVIMQALEKGKKVGVVVLTNGDGFPRGTAAFTGKDREDLKPGDFLALARERQRQSFEGITHVGLKRSDLVFLGYPDGGLAEIYRSESDAPYLQPHTKKRETDALLAGDYHSLKHGKSAPYTKAAILGDLAEIIRERKPSEIYVTHELDQHSDHRAAMGFVRDAAALVGFEGKLYTFIVHGEKLPEGEPRRVALTPKQLAAKKAAIGVHKIPEVHDHLVESHAKPEEWFWLVSVESPKSSAP